MLLGEHKHSLDEKGRIAIPAKFRSEFKDGAIITRGIDSCLFVFNLSEWKTLVEKIKSLPLTGKESRAFSRLLIAGAVDVRLDGQGRVLIPDYLRNYAGLDSKAVLAGVDNRLEIWDVDKWENYKKKTEESSEDIAEHLGGLGV